MVVSIIHLISVLCKTQWGQLNQAAPQVTQKSFCENRPQKALCSFSLGGRQARVKHNVLCKAGGRYNVGRGGGEGGKCKQGTRTYGVTGLFWEVPGWGVDRAHAAWGNAECGVNGRWGLGGRRGGWELSRNRTRLGHQVKERNAIHRDL